MDDHLDRLIDDCWTGGWSGIAEAIVYVDFAGIVFDIAQISVQATIEIVHR